MKRHFSRSQFFGIAALLAVFLTACTSVRLNSVKDATNVHKLDRLFVIVAQGQLNSTKFADQFIEQFRAQLTNSAVKVEFSILTPLELDEKTHLEKAKAFQADAILFVRAVSGVRDQYGGYPTIIYDASLFDPEFKKRLWRANINNSGGTGLMSRRMREMAEQIVKQLQNDGFL